MRNRRAMYAFYAVIALGIGTYVACSDGTRVSTVPTPALEDNDEQQGEPGIVPDPQRSYLDHAADTGGPEVRHGDGHRVWVEWATPGSAQELCEGDYVPAAVLRRDDPQGAIYAMVYVSDPEHEDRAADGETGDAGKHLSNGEDIDLAVGEMSYLMSYMGTIPYCPACGDTRELVAGISSVHDRNEGSDHAGTYEIGPELRFAVYKITHAVCRGTTAARLRGN